MIIRISPPRPMNEPSSKAHVRNVDDEKEIDEMEMQYRGNNNADDI